MGFTLPVEIIRTDYLQGKTYLLSTNARLYTGRYEWGVFEPWFGEVGEGLDRGQDSVRR